MRPAHLACLAPSRTLQVVLYIALGRICMTSASGTTVNWHQLDFCCMLKVQYRPDTLFAKRQRPRQLRILSSITKTAAVALRASRISCSKTASTCMLAVRTAPACMHARHILVRVFAISSVPGSLIKVSTLVASSCTCGRWLCLSPVALCANNTIVWPLANSLNAQPSPATNLLAIGISNLVQGIRRPITL